MTLREDVDRINMTHLQCFNKSIGVKLIPDSPTFERGMKIQVNLAKTVVVLPFAIHGFQRKIWLSSGDFL